MWRLANLELVHLMLHSSIAPHYDICAFCCVAPSYFTDMPFHNSYGHEFEYCENLLFALMFLQEYNA